GSTALSNFGHNIDLRFGATNNVVGGVAAGAGNRIAFANDALRSGVRIRTGAYNNLISSDAIFGNGQLGIDADQPGGGSGYGVNTNAPCESGVVANAANGGQNFPTLSNIYSGSITRVRGSLNSKVSRVYTLQFFD